MKRAMTQRGVIVDYDEDIVEVVTRVPGTRNTVHATVRKSSKEKFYVPVVKIKREVRHALKKTYLNYRRNYTRLMRMTLCHTLCIKRKTKTIVVGKSAIESCEKVKLFRKEYFLGLFKKYQYRKIEIECTAYM